MARSVCERAAVERAGRLRILDLGCGSGWLGAGLSGYGEVTGVDISDAAVAAGRTAYPDITLLVGDAVTAPLEVGSFDVVVSADVISHVADQQGFVSRVAELVRIDGWFLLMTQNPTVWRRNSQLVPQQPGQLRNWPSVVDVRRMFDGQFSIERFGTVHPVGDLGFLRVVNSRWISGPMRIVGLKSVWRRARERARLGCELTFEARRLP